jgi:hypothetical protein
VQRQKQEDKLRLYGAGVELSYFILTSEKWIARIIASMLLCLVILWTWADSVCRLPSVFIVGLGLYSAGLWLPVFGIIEDTYTLRGFWG